MSDAAALPFVPVAAASPLLPAGWTIEPPSREELLALLSDEEALALERCLVRVARARGAVELAIGEGLAALAVGDRAMRKGWSSLKDHAREILDLQERMALNLARLARELRRRPLLRAAVRSGEVSIRRAQAVLRVAVGEDEARWVALAREETVRALERAVRREADPDEGEDGWAELSVPLAPEKRAVVDEALALAGKELGPGSTRAQRLEAIAQEWLGTHPPEGDEDPRLLGGGFRPLSSAPTARLEELKERLERETERWACLEEVELFPAVEDGLDEERAPTRIDARLRELASMWRSWDRLVGYLALMVKRSRMWHLLGFTSFSHYADERLGLGIRTVEQRAALEERLWELPALRKAVEDGLSYEKARIVSRCRDPREVEAWIARARDMTCIALRRAMEAGEDAQTR